MGKDTGRLAASAPQRSLRPGSIRAPLSHWAAGWRTYLVLLGVLVVAASVMLPLGAMTWASLRAQQLLDRVERGAPGADTIDRALGYVDLAQRIVPDSPRLYRLRARAHYLRGDYTAAVAALERAVALAPASISNSVDLAQQYTLAGRTEQARALWQGLGIDHTRLDLYGDQAFARADYRDATMWYELAERAGRDPEQALFMRTVTAAYAQLPTAAFITRSQAASFYYRVGPRGVFIPGNDLRWLSSQAPTGVANGTPLKFKRAGDGGTLWWNGAAAAVVEVPAAGVYQIDLSVCHCVPQPIQMRLAVNNQTITPLLLTRGDDTRAVVRVRLPLPPGPQVIQVWFENNQVVDSVDRNAKIYWLALRPVVSQ